MKGASVSAMVFVGVLAACADGTTGGGAHKQGSAQVGGEVVSTVDGDPITRDDVQRFVDASGLSPREALDLLTREALLMGEATRRGYGKRSEVQLVADQARVQELLKRDIERIQATPEELAEAYAKQRDRFVQPERRRAVHVLAQLPKGASPEAEEAARALATEAAKAFAIAIDPQSVLEEFAKRSTPLFKARVEQLPAVPNGAFVPEFSNALFGAAAVGPLAEPVRTEFGYHAIYLVEIIPATSMDLAEASKELGSEIAVAKRKKQLDELVAELRRDARIVVDPAGQKVLSALEF